MANWKKLAVSGSATSFPQLKVDTSITASIFSGSQFIGSLIGTASYATNADTAISSSYALSASYAPGSDTSISASYALSSSYALNASTADSATSASYALTASYVLDKTIVTGSNAIFSQPTPASTWVFNHFLNNQYPVFTVFNASNQVIIPTSITADNTVTATITFSVPTAGTAVASIGGFTGSAPTVLSASYAATASFAFTAAYALNVPETSSYAITASYALTATSASYALNATSASRAISAANADNATSASYALSSSYALNASTAISASRATSALNADTASYVNTLNQAVVISGSLSINTTTGNAFDINADTFIFTGSFNQTGSVFLTGLTQVSKSFVVGYDNTTGQLSYQTAVDNADTASYALFAVSASKAVSASYADSVTGSATLTTGLVTKWTGAAFANSSITDSTNVTINNAGGVLIQQGGLYVTGSSTFHDNVFVEGNLTVAGTASFQNSQNLAIADQFILLNSGSTTFQDSGFIINTGNTGNSGSAFFLETAGTTTGTAAPNGRFAVGSQINPDATTVTAAEYAVTALISGSAPGVSVPQFGGTGLGQGNMWIDTNTDELFIYF